MLEATLKEAVILKRLLDAIKELVTDGNFDCDHEGLRLQAMDNSHVALVAVHLHSEGFSNYRCDRPMPLGVNLGSLTKVLKCAKDDDEVQLSAGETGDLLRLVYQAKAADRISEYEIKLMDIDSETLTIPETDYDAKITMSSAEFGRICRDLGQLGESVRIEVSKDGVRFSSEGDAANGSILLKPAGGEKIKKVGGSSKKTKVKKEVKDEDDGDVKMVEDEASEKEDDDDEVEEVKPKVKKEKVSDDEGEDNEEEEEEEEDSKAGKKRKRGSPKESKPKKKSKKSNDDDDEDDENVQGVTIAMSQHVNLTFSLKYLSNFAKSGSLCNRVSLSLSNDVPLLVAYDFKQGTINYYLAPKIGDE